MHGKQLVKKFALDPERLAALTDEALGATTVEELDQAMGQTVGDVAPNQIVRGRVLRVMDDGTVFVDVGYKAEGRIPLDEFDDPTAVLPGAEVECLVEAIWDEDGYIELSKRKADRIRGWEKIIETHKEGDVVAGTVTRKIKGGLLVDIGVPVFLPASQVNIRRTGDIGEWIGRDVKASIIKIDEERMNIVISRRKLIEEEREELKQKLLGEIEEGQIRTGIVKNIADFGVFVDLGGLDGLLHITDMSWGRINHPSEMVSIDDEVEVKVLKIDRERERIALGMKQKQPSPWENIEDKYPVGLACDRRGRQPDVLRRLREARGRRRGSRAHLRDVLDQARQPSERGRQRRRSRRGRRARDQQGEAGDQPRHEADRGEPLGHGLETATRRGRSSGAGCATSPTTARSSSCRRASTACCTSRTCPGRRRSRIRPRS